MTEFTRGATLASLFFATFVGLATPSHADEQITDPRLWTDSVVKLISEHKFEAFANEMIASSGGGMTSEDFITVTPSLEKLLKNSGEFVFSERIALKNYGSTISMSWYLVVYSNKDLYFSARLIRHGEYWHVEKFDFDTDFDDAELP